MKRPNNLIKVALILITVSLLFTIGAQTSPQQNRNDSASLRQILATQPDYVAVQQFIFSEGFGGFGATSRVARLGNRYREEDDERILIDEPGRPTIVIYPRRREYAERPPVEIDSDFTNEPGELAARDDVIVTSLGTERVGEYDCVKIEVRYREERLRDAIRFVFYAAPQLRNLIIKRETFLGPTVRFITQLSDVSFNVSEELFRIPTRYRRIVEQSYEERTREFLQGLGDPQKRL